MGIRVQRKSTESSEGIAIPNLSPVMPVDISIARGGIKFIKVDRICQYFVRYTAVVEPYPSENMKFFFHSPYLYSHPDKLDELWSICYDHLKGQFPSSEYEVTDT